MEQKVYFYLKQKDDWPPFASEFIWANSLGDDRYQLNNIPFFAEGVSFGDVIKADIQNGNPWFVNIVKASTNSTLRVFCFDTQKKIEFSKWLGQNSCMSELGFEGEYIVANIPGTIDIDALEQFLADIEEPGQFEFEFSCLRLVLVSLRDD
ncbi:DUF4265 domain-containing protein [Stenoxybacter acetivorans]|uniref:DUF4265 domain-containing protein n=1 Tax=Stenoxybacter acetivorans TaxID=422441 RepID=UPI00055BC8B3|nr:DUF4265 domain-containing protein [Stenoxybacter acetivorans]